jgi:hypothetical protein
MQPATIRRLLVFGVCLVGVMGLYLLPGTSGSPRDLGSPAGRDLPTARPGVASVAAVTTPVLVPATTGSTGVSPHTGSLRAGADRPAARPMATARQPGKDQSPPGAVGALSVTRLDAERLTVTWPEATDDVGVVSYDVWLNGFFVVSTQQPRVSLPWFNDSSTHVVQVRAQDAVGNEGPTSPTLLVIRPSPSPAASSSPSVAGTGSSSPITRADAGVDEVPDPTHNPAPTAGTSRSSDADKEEPS